MPSIRDVAQAVGCSTSTVSRVINNRDGVNPTTREKVLQAIEELEYKPNLVAQGLRVKRGNLIGLAVPESTTHAFSVLIQYIMDAAHRRGYNIIIVNSNENPDLEERFISDLLRRNINGIVFSRVSDESRIMPKILKHNIPIVVIDRALENERVSNVVLDNRKAGYLAGKHLVELKHRHITCVTGPMKIALCRERLKGFKESLDERGVVLPKGNIYEGNFKFDSGISAVRNFHDRGIQYTALWALNDMMAFGALKELHRLALKVPEDISVLGMDDLEFGTMIVPPLSSIHYPFDELAEEAIDLLIRQIEGHALSTDTIMVQPSISIKESTGTCQQSM
jgi:LacI family transcriptional regulator